MYSNKVYILFVLLILITFVIYAINQNSEEIKKQSLVHSDEENISSSLDISLRNQHGASIRPGIQKIV